MATIIKMEVMSFTVWIIITAVVPYIKRMALKYNDGMKYR